MDYKCGKCGQHVDIRMMSVPKHVLHKEIIGSEDCDGTLYPGIPERLKIEEDYYSKQKPRIPEFIELLERMRAIHLKKNKDYAAESNPFENFERSSLLIEWFDDPIDKAFISLIGTKLARLATLLNKSGQSPENESIEDSFLDLCTYCALWTSYRARLFSKLQKQDNPHLPA